jgi:hypothetical protein
VIERNIKLTIEELNDELAHVQSFIISIGPNGAEIRLAGSPIMSRDRSTTAVVGGEPNYVNLALHVEELP